MRSVGALGIALLVVSSCTLDRSIDPKLILTGCTANADCPGSQTCQITQGFSYCTATTAAFTIGGPSLSQPVIGPKSQLRATYTTTAPVTGQAMLIGPGGLLINLTAEPDLRFLLEGTQVVDVNDGVYTLFSFFRDGKGNLATGTPVDVAVDSAPPGSRAPRFTLTPAVGSLADQFGLSLTAAGPKTHVAAQLVLDEELAPGSTLVLLAPDGGPALTFDHDGGTAFELTPPADPSLPQGPLTARLTLTDRAGNSRTDDYPGVTLDTVVPSLGLTRSTLVLAPWGTLDDPTPVSKVDVTGLPEAGELFVFQGPFSVGHAAAGAGSAVALSLLSSTPPFDVRLVDRAGNESAPKSVSRVALTFTPRDIDATDDERVLELRANQVAPRLIPNPSLTTQPPDAGLVLASSGAWRARPTSPGALSEMAVAFDGDREVAVAFGGINGLNKSNATLEWQGQGWFKRPTSVAPPPATRDDVAMAYDSLREVVLLFYGLTGDTWSWDGNRWNKISVPTAMDSAPAKRTHFAMAFDKRAGNLVLFGGKVGATELSDTWVWNGLSWKKLAPKSSPEARAGHVMAYHPPSGGVVMFGDDKRTFGDVWWWDGLAQEWSKQPGPGPLFTPAMAFDDNELKLQAIDLATGKLHSLTGSSDGGGLSGFAWDAGPDVVPAPAGAATFFDSARRTLVLANAVRRWSLKPDTVPAGWTNFISNRPPPPLEHHALAWNAGADTHVLFGGKNALGAATNELYCFSSEGWQQGSTDGGPPPERWGHTLTASPNAMASTRMILHGGFDGSGVPLADTWQFNFVQRGCQGLWTRKTNDVARGGHLSVWDGDRLLVWDADAGAQWQDVGPGGTWSPLNAASASSPAGFYAAAAFDSRERRIVAAGGGTATESCDGGGCRSGTATLGADGGTWQPLPALLSPARKGHALWFDTFVGSAFTFGGATASVAASGTLARLGSGWAPQPVADLESDFEPAERAFHAMAFSPATASALMFGGAVNGVPSDETWDFKLAKQRPAVVFHIDLNRFVFKPFGRVTFTGLKLEAIAGGEGTSLNGAELQGYFDGRWKTLPNGMPTAATPSAPGLCRLETTDRLDELLVGNRRLSVAVTPLGESAEGAAQLRVDRLAVQVTFDLP